MKRLLIQLLLVAAVIAVMAGCQRHHERVVSTWSDGSPHIVQTLRGDESNGVKVGERHYYENGQLQCDKCYSDQGRRDGTWRYYYPDGTLFAEAAFDARHQNGKGWTMYHTDGTIYATDSMEVLDLGDMENPSTVLFHHDSTTTLRQFFSDGAIRSEGAMRNGRREGLWRFYFANGLPQVEATYLHGREQGAYTVYRESGIPYYRGQYVDGRRVGTWELYNEEGTLTSTQDYGK